LRQVQSMPCSASPNRLMTELPLTQLVRNIYGNEGGISAFWRGNGAAIAHRAFQSSITFATIAGCNKLWPRDRTSSGFEKFFHSLSISTGAALLSTVIAHPIDVVKTRLYAERGDLSQGSRYYSSPCNALSVILRDEGTRGLFRGLGMSISSVVPTIALNVTLFDTFLPHIRKLDMHARWGGLSNRRQEKATKSEVALCGGCSAACASSALFPLDVMKKQMQLVGSRGSAEVYRDTCMLLNRSISEEVGLKGSIEDYRWK